jgi:hypothetical protein
MIATVGESRMGPVADRARFEGHAEARMWADEPERPWDRDDRNDRIPRPILIA